MEIAKTIEELRDQEVPVYVSGTYIDPTRETHDENGGHANNLNPVIRSNSKYLLLNDLYKLVAHVELDDRIIYVLESGLAAGWQNEQTKKWVWDEDPTIFISVYK